jgi:hypothetical protein
MRVCLLTTAYITTAYILSALVIPGAMARTANAPDKPLSPVEQALVDNEKEFIAAAKKGDAAYFKRALADDFSFVALDGELGGRQDMIDNFSSGGIDIMPYDMKVLRVSDGVAVVTYDVVYRVPPSEDEGPPPRYQHFSSLWVKQGEAWKMKFQQVTASHWGDW